VLRNLKDAGFAGAIQLVNPRYSEIDGIRAASSLDHLPNAPDVVAITAPAPLVPRIVADAARHHVSCAIIITAGLGNGPGSLAEACEREARTTGMRLVGPNCLGVIAPWAKFNASFASGIVRPGDIALLSQSGAIAAGMIEWSRGRSVGFSALVSIGDQLDVDLGDLLDYFALDHRTRAIVLYIESVKEARKFMSAARAAARAKPVIVVKSGRYSQSAKAAATHTGALAGSDAVYDAAFRRVGLLRALDLEELFDAIEILGRMQTPVGKRLAILTNGGGLGVLAVDRLLDLGGAAADLSENARATLDGALPSTWSKANPVDIGGDADSARYGAALDALLDDPANDAVLVMNVQTALTPAVEIASAVAEIVQQRRKVSSRPKPVLSVWAGTAPAVSSVFDSAGIPNYPTEASAVRGFIHLARYAEASRTLLVTPPTLREQVSAESTAARKIVRSAVADGRDWLEPVEAAEVLAAYGIPILPVLPAANAIEAAEAAAPYLAKGQAVAVKIRSRDIIHKSDVGGVRLNLTSADAVRHATEEMIEAARRARPKALIDGVVVQPMVTKPKARELIAGVADDPIFGPVIAFGHGGVGVEVIDDKAIGLPPLDAHWAAALIGRTRVAKLLQAYRNVPAAKIEDIVLVLVNLSQLVADLPEIRELDINPLLADETGVLALDARIAVAPVGQAHALPGHPRLAIRPYPAEWQRRVQFGDASTALVRPVRPEDEELFREFFGQISPEDLRLRFFAPVKDFSHAFIARLTQIDYARAMAFVAIDDNNRAMLGAVRLHCDANYETGEYAILVRSDLKGQGLGWQLMQLMIDYAKSEGLRTVEGQVLRENTGMLRMCQELGFAVGADPRDTTVCIVRLNLQ
jgi:acetyltransferase